MDANGAPACGASRFSGSEMEASMSESRFSAEGFTPTDNPMKTGI